MSHLQAAQCHTAVGPQLPVECIFFSHLLQTFLVAKNYEMQESTQGEIPGKQLSSVYMHNNHVSLHVQYNALNQQSNYHPELVPVLFY